MLSNVGVTEDNSRSSRIAADPDRLCVWVMPGSQSADRIFLMPVARALYRAQNPVYNFGWMEMMESFPKLGSITPDAEKIFGKYVRRFMRRQDIDAAVVFGFNHIMQENGQLINLLEEAGFPHFSLLISDPREVLEPEQVETLAGYHHWHPLVLDPELAEELQDELPGIDWRFLPPATDTHIYRPLEDGQSGAVVDCRVAVIAEMSDPVVEMIRELGTDQVGIWDGPEWSEHEEFSEIFREASMEDAQLNRIYNGVDIVVHNDRVTSLATQRSLNVLAAGGLPLGPENPQLAELCSGTELPFLGEPDSWGDTVRHWLDNPDERERTARAAARQVREQHSWDNRVDELLELVRSAAESKKVGQAG